jgi:predicted chitinase
MRQITEKDLMAICPRLDKDRAAIIAASLNPAMEWANIDTPERQAAFLSQCAHECDGFMTMREYASGREYEGREDLGNTEEGDGERYAGRGYIQITGRANYTQAAADLDLDLVNSPELAESPEGAAYVSAWYWNSRNLNRFADSGDFITLTRRINGGLNGLASRKIYWARAKEVLGC